MYRDASNWVLAALALAATSCGSSGVPEPPSVIYADCEVWGEKGFNHLECFIIVVAGVDHHRLELVRDDGLTVVPKNMTLEKVKEMFPDLTSEDRGGGRLSVDAGGLKWSFHGEKRELQLVRALWRTDWRVRNIDNGRELTFPCTSVDVVKVLGKDGYTKTSQDGKRKL